MLSERANLLIEHGFDVRWADLLIKLLDERPNVIHTGAFWMNVKEGGSQACENIQLKSHKRYIKILKKVNK